MVNLYALLLFLKEGLSVYGKVTEGFIILTALEILAYVDLLYLVKNKFNKHSRIHYVEKTKKTFIMFFMDDDIE